MGVVHQYIQLKHHCAISPCSPSISPACLDESTISLSYILTDSILSTLTGLNMIFLQIPCEVCTEIPTDSPREGRDEDPESLANDQGAEEVARSRGTSG